MVKLLKFKVHILLCMMLPVNKEAQILKSLNKTEDKILFVVTFHLTCHETSQYRCLEICSGVQTA